MTQPDLSSLALPDSPDPAMLEAALRWLRILARPVPGARYNSPAAAQTANAQAILDHIAKHLLTAEEAAHISGIHTNISISAMTCSHCANIAAKLRRMAVRRLSGSSRGEDARRCICSSSMAPGAECPVHGEAP